MDKYGFDDDDDDEPKRSLLSGSMGLGSLDRPLNVFFATGLGSRLFTRDTVMAGRRSCTLSFTFKRVTDGYLDV